MPGYLVPAQQSTNPFTPTNLVSSSTVGDAIVELSRKTVNVFASEAARSSAIPTPTTGMISYLADSGSIQVYNGSSWVDAASGTNPLFLAGN